MVFGYSKIILDLIIKLFFAWKLITCIQAKEIFTLFMKNLFSVVCCDFHFIIKTFSSYRAKHYMEMHLGFAEYKLGHGSCWESWFLNDCLICMAVYLIKLCCSTLTNTCECFCNMSWERQFSVLYGVWNSVCKGQLSQIVANGPIGLIDFSIYKDFHTFYLKSKFVSFLYFCSAWVYVIWIN
jgi:hypothetical protein